jgi:phosphoglycolate phosphatase
VPRKPYPACAFDISEMIEFDPEKILFVGDSDNDILTAQAAGMIPVGVSWGYGRLLKEPVKGDYPMIHKPSELLNLID